MSVLWTVMASDAVWSGYGAATVPPPQEVQVGGVTMLVSPNGDGTGRVERLLSLDPAHFLRPDCQPGTRVRMPLGD